jgi:predicted  nucleic acid-binding Zn-ribbon protein
VRTPAKFAIGLVLIGSSVSVLYFGGRRVVEQQRTTAENTRLRDELYRARGTANRCRRSIAASEGALRDFDTRLDEMRAEVEGFEERQGAGVPADQYDTYMTRFEIYNDSVAIWEARERQLRAADTSCRGVITAHNETRDSLQRVLDAVGITSDRSGVPRP